jgi:hypothetical protein
MYNSWTVMSKVIIVRKAPLHTIQISLHFPLQDLNTITPTKWTRTGLHTFIFPPPGEILSGRSTVPAPVQAVPAPIRQGSVILFPLVILVESIFFIIKPPKWLPLTMI